MNTIDTITLEVADPAAARAFYSEAFGLDSQLRFRRSDAPTSGFRGFTLSLVVAQPADVDALTDAAVAGGATAIKPATKSFWGYGSSVQAPDGTIWTIASSSKRNKGPASKSFDDLVLLLGCEDVAASKAFYVERGLSVARSFGRKYVEFEAGDGPVKLALNGRRALAKNAGVSPEGTGSHRIVINGGDGAATDPDGFVWDTARVDAS